MKNLIFTTLFLLFASTNGFTQTDTLTINGHYLGKDIYLSNPQLDSPSEFCILQVSLNGILIPTAKLAVLHVKLSHLQMNDPVNLVIVHKEECRPYLLDKTCIFSSEEQKENKTENSNYFLFKRQATVPCIKH